ncbi:hypothetical protein [Curtobacterium sp. MCBA15_001]|uniref:hypothetical protein n=1 Tax=Curtobacterium sp. MCBA15_001 TaxID=1898731 RepID=UPI0008DDFADD|nr:hypothetical protein [Curtobacterium sp. MCBA15_001]OIH92821.1 hypothetical protein BIU90_10010 [Curtobacterium sp. MCBA15_001]
MTLLEHPIGRLDVARGVDFPTPHLTRDPDELTSRITLPNGAQVELVGFVGSICYPPNYLEDLRAGRL